MDKTDYGVLIVFLFLYIILIFCSQCPYIDFFRFLIICLCLLPALRYGVPTAAFYTIISDFFLLFTHYTKLGVYFFCLVQLFYIAFLLNKKPPLFVVFFLLLFLVFPLPVLGAIYGFLFFIHAFIAFFLQNC